MFVEGVAFQVYLGRLVVNVACGVFVVGVRVVVEVCYGILWGSFKIVRMFVRGL